MKTASLLMLFGAACACIAAAAGPADKIKLDSVLVTVIEEVEVPAREAGVLTTVAVREGQMVSENAVLAKIDDADAQLAERRARIEHDIARKQAQNLIKVQAAKKSVEVAEAELKRSIESVEKFKKSVSQSEIDRLRLVAERAALEVEQAKQDFDTAELTRQLKENEHALAVHNVERRKIISPISGVVVQVNPRRGEWVKPGDVVLRILRIDRLRAEGFLNAREVTGDLTGRRITLRVDLPGKPQTEFPGTLTFVSPEINPVNGQIRVWAEFENRDLLLRPGLQASLTIDPPAQAARRDAP